MESDLERVAAELQQSARLAEGQRGSRRENAFRLVREAMSNATGLMSVTEAACEAILHLVSAWEVTVSLLDRGHYWGVVDVCVEQSRYPRFPNSRYPIEDYPIGTERVLAGKGFVSGDAADEVLAEYERHWRDVPVGSIMGVPIVALGEVHGEVFLVRDRDTPAFDRDDLDLVSELATLLGARLPALVAAYEESQGGSVAAEQPMPGLTTRLDEHLR